MTKAITIICDRCGNHVVVKERDEYKYERQNARMRWEHLCLKCLKEYEEMESLIAQFRDKQEARFYNER